MRTIRGMAIPILLSSAWLAPLPVRGEKAKPTPLASAVEAVTVYRDRALVTRVAKLDCQAGGHLLKMTNLPLSLLDESVRVSGSGSTPARILDIKIRSERLEESAFTRIQELENEQRELGDRLRALDDRLALLAREDDFLASLLTEKSAGPDQERELQKKGTSEWAQIVAFLENNLGRIFGEKRNLETERRRILGKKAVVDHELGQQNEMRGKERKSIEIEIEADRAGSLQLEASYIVPQVSWIPVYDMRFRSGKNEASLACQALVRQETGEDWENVLLTLSTARPMVENSLPVLNPQTLDRPQLVSQPGANVITGRVILMDQSAIPGALVTLLAGTNAVRSAVTTEAGEFQLADLSPGTYSLRCELEGFKTVVHRGIRLTAERNVRITIPMETAALKEEIVVTAKAPLIDTRKTSQSYTFRSNDIPSASGRSQESGPAAGHVVEEPVSRQMEAPGAGVSAQAVAATFALRQKETVLSNNVPQKVTMAVETVPVQREYQAIPKLMEQSFLKATASNDTPFPLLAGKVSIFYDENFVSSTAIPQVSANEKFTVPIGEASGIKVKRELVGKKSDESGLFSKKTRVVYEYRITVENFQKTEETVTVFDQTPVTENEDVAIELLRVDPAPQKPKEEEAEKEKKEGLLKWRLQLKPLEKATVRFAYSVSYPKKLEVYNLD